MRGADISRAADKWRGDLCGSISSQSCVTVKMYIWVTYRAEHIVAAVAFLAWDTCITLDDEVEWIWL